MNFHGKTFSPPHDETRLTGQLLRVFFCMSSGSWKTLKEIQEEVGGSEAGVSARLRDLRKPGNGAYVVERRRRGKSNKGLHEYRLLNPASKIDFKFIEGQGVFL